MHNPDLSREKSLYHLLLTVVRRLNAPITPHKKQISDALKLLVITKSDGEYLITINDTIKPRSTSINVSDVKFYDTKNDPSIAEKNLKTVNQIVINLFPELDAKSGASRNVKQFNYIDVLFAFYSLSLSLFYILDSQIFLGIPASIAFGFIPFWNLSSNLNPKVRWLGSLCFSTLCYAVFYSPISGSWIEIHIAIMFSLFILHYLSNRILGVFTFPVFIILIALVIFHQDYQTMILTITFVITEKFIEFLFGISKKFGLIAIVITLLALMALMLWELASSSNPYASMFLGILIFGYFQFIYGVGTSWGGSLRTILPSLGALSLEGMNTLIYLASSLFLFTCFKVISIQIDRKFDAI